MKKKECAVLDVADRALTAVEETGGDASDLRHELAFAVADTCQERWRKAADEFIKRCGGGA